MTLNDVKLIGRLGKKTKASTTPKGTAVSTFYLATDESYKGQDGQTVEQTEWHRCVVYGKPADFCNTYLDKGRLVLVNGSLRTRKWTDEEKGDQSVTEVIVAGGGGKNYVKVLDSAKRGEPTGAEAGDGDVPF